MAKRGLCILLAVLTLFALAVPAFAADGGVVENEPKMAAATSGSCGDNVKWSFSGGTLTISGTGKMGSGSGWADYRSQIKKVIIKKGVTSISDWAFSGCDNLTSVTIPEGVTEIGFHSFFDCYDLTSVTIPESVTFIGDFAFNLTGISDIKIAKGNKNYVSVDGVLFSADKTEVIWYSRCRMDSSYVIPNTVKTIHSGAFCNNDFLDSITIPASVTSIGGDAFTSQCLTAINVAKGSKSYASVDGVLFSADKKTLVHYPQGKTASSYAIPNTVITIAGSAVFNCNNLTIVTIPESVTSIGEGAFGSCYSLTSMTIPASVTSIGEAAFGYCDKLTSIKVLNPNCEIESGYGNTLGVPGTTVVSGYAGSTAEAYAKKFGYTFKSLGKAPSANTQLAAPTVKIAQTKSGIQVTWNAVSGSSRYMVYYKENGGSWQKIGTTAKTSYTRAEKYLKAGATYQFTVRCCAADGKTLLSTYKASNNVKYAPELAAPTVKIAQTSGGIQVSWNAVKGSDRYMVYYKENGGSWQKIGTTAKTSYTRAASKLKNGATYQFTVRCCASDGKTLLSSYKASNKVKYAPELAAPTVKIAQTSGGIQVTWNAVSGSSRYMVYYKENGGSWQKIGTTAKTSYTRAAKYLKAGVTYQFAVRCCASDGKTLLSTYQASNKVKYTVELAAPTVKIAQTKSGIQVTWNAVSGSSRYMVYYKENGGSWQKIGTTAKTSYTRAASKLKNGATYQFTVRCCASDKKTLLSSYKASNKVKYTVELTAPTVKIAQTSGGIQVTWNAVSGSSRYMVYYKENGGKWQKIGTTAKTSYTRASSKLKNGATYQFTVRCCASDGKTLLSAYQASNKVTYAK